MKKSEVWKKENRCVDFRLTKVSLSGYFFVLLLTSFFLSSSFAESDPAEGFQKVFNKTLSGTVGAVSSRGFALVYKEESSTEYEMWLPYHDTVIFTGGYAGAEDVTTNDEVQVSYDETEDKKTRTLKSVSLIKKGEPPVIVEETTDETEEADAETNE